jgi:hypothetical protein
LFGWPNGPSKCIAGEQKIKPKIVSICWQVPTPSQAIKFVGVKPRNGKFQQKAEQIGPQIYAPPTKEALQLLG